MKWIFSWLVAGSLCVGGGATADEPQPPPPAGSTPSVPSTPLAPPADASPMPSAFEVVLLALKDDWQAMRYHKHSGESWFTLKGDWKAVPEAGEAKPPEGDYKVVLAASGDNDFVALRLERKSGRSWRLAALKWVEMKVLGDEPVPPQPQQPPLPAPVLETETE